MSYSSSQSAFASEKTSAPNLTLRTAKVVRAMLRLGTFTRKQLAEKTREDITYVQQVIDSQDKYLKTLKKVRSGRPGPPEEVLAITEQGEIEFLKILDFNEDQKEENAASGGYVPSPMQFRVASELIEEIEARKELPDARLERLLSLFRYVARNEGLPEEDRVGDSQDSDRSQWSERKRIASSRVDELKGKLCWLALNSAERKVHWEPEKYFADELGTLGLKYLQASASEYQRQAATGLAKSVDLWSANYVYPVLMDMLTQGPETGLESFLAVIKPDDLPRVHRIVSRIAHPKPVEILEGLVNYYDSYCNTIGEGAVALLDIRQSGMTLAIVSPGGRMVSQCDPLSATEGQNFEPVKVVSQCLASYRQGHEAGAVKRLFVTGDRPEAISFQTLAAKSIPAVRVGDFLQPKEAKEASSNATFALTRGKFLNATEVGLTLKAARVQGVGTDLVKFSENF